MFNNFPFPEDALGVVDRTTDHFEYFHGSIDDDRSTWRVMARLGGTNEQPVIELEPGFDEKLLQHTRREIATCLSDDSDRTYVGYIDSKGKVRRAWRESLAMTCGMTWNLYGDCHWRSVRGQPRAEDAP
jgi:hypothetical protein